MVVKFKVLTYFYMKIILIIFGVLFISSNSFAQGTATGCLLPNNLVYTSQSNKGPKYYRQSPATSLTVNYCSWTPSTTGTSCTVCFGKVNNGNGSCSGTTTIGYAGTFTMVQCPIDESYGFILVGMLISIISFRKIKLSLI